MLLKLYNNFFFVSSHGWMRDMNEIKIDTLGKKNDNNCNTLVMLKVGSVFAWQYFCWFAWLPRAHSKCRKIFSTGCAHVDVFPVRVNTRRSNNMYTHTYYIWSADRVSRCNNGERPNDARGCLSIFELRIQIHDDFTKAMFMFFDALLHISRAHCHLFDTIYALHMEWMQLTTNFGQK